MRKQDRVHDAVGDPGATTQHVAQTMMKRHGRVRDAETRQIGAQQQILARLDIVAGRDAERERSSDMPKPFEGDRRNHRVHVPCVAGLHAVGERVHASRGGEARRQVECCLGVIDRQAWQDGRIALHPLAAFGPVGDADHRGHLRSGVSCGDSDQRHSLAQRDPLPYSNRAPTSHRDHHIDLHLARERTRRLDRLARNVRRDISELRHQPAAERCADSCRMSRGLEAGRANKENALAQRLSLGTDAVDRPAPEEDAGRVECPAVTGRAVCPPSFRAGRPRSPAIPHPGP